MGIGLDLEASKEQALPTYGAKPPIMSIEQLLAYGFKEWPTAPHDKHNRHWQYCVRDEKGKKLYVQVRLWAFSQYSNSERVVFDSFDAYCQFDMRAAKTFNVDISVNDMTPAQVIEWFDKMHVRMGCTYYELWADEQYDEDGKKTSFNCEKCGRYLPPDESVEPFLCPACRYEKETGFKHAPVVLRKKRTR